jgi:hypothetical protein
MAGVLHLEVYDRLIPYKCVPNLSLNYFADKTVAWLKGHVHWKKALSFSFRSVDMFIAASSYLARAVCC